MDKMPMLWKLKTKWYPIKQTCQQFGNFVIGRTVTSRGDQAYDYYCKVIFENYDPINYSDLMAEDELQKMMSDANCDRRSAAILLAGTLAKSIAPWEFWKKKYHIVSN